MNLYAFARPTDLRNASAKKFAASFRNEVQEFADKARERVDFNLLSLLMGVSNSVADNPATRAWRSICSCLTAEMNRADFVPPAHIVSHLSPDAPKVDRLYELLVWEGLGAACKPTVSIHGRGQASPPTILAIGTEGVMAINDADSITKGWEFECGGGSVSITSKNASASTQGLNCLSSYTPNPIVVGEGIFATVPIFTPSLTPAHFQEFPIVRSPSFVRLWGPQVAVASSVISAYSAIASDAVNELVSCVLPLVCARESVGSGSREEVLGQVYLPATDSLSTLSECLLHEAMHQYLFRLEECRELFALGNPDEGQYYSPWRSDARPLRMVLHGAFVFACIADLYLWTHAPARFEMASSDCQKRAYQCARQARVALDCVIRNAALTQIGALLARAIERDLGRILEDAAPSPEDRAAVEERLRQHEEEHAAYRR